MKKADCFAFVIVLMILAILAPLPLLSQATEGTVRIGTFDSRCVAIAYGRSVVFMDYMNGLRADLQKAKDEGNTERVKELEQLGPNSQVVMHQQGFSTGSVGNIIAKIKDKIPAIAKQHSVVLILSKWELFHHDDSVELVDITDQLVSLFTPDAQTLQIVKDIRNMEPVPIEAVSGDPRR